MLPLNREAICFHSLYRAILRTALTNRTIIVTSTGHAGTALHTKSTHRHNNLHDATTAVRRRSCSMTLLFWTWKAAPLHRCPTHRRIGEAPTTAQLLQLLEQLEGSTAGTQEAGRNHAIHNSAERSAHQQGYTLATKAVAPKAPVASDKINLKRRREDKRNSSSHRSRGPTLYTVSAFLSSHVRQFVVEWLNERERTRILNT